MLHAHVHPLGRAQRLQDGGAGPAARRRSRHQERDHQHRGRVGLRLAARRGGRPPAGAHLALRRERAPAHLVRQRLRLPGHRRDHQDRDRREGPAHRHHALGRRRRPARQQDRVGRARHAPPDRHRRALATASGRSTRTSRPRCASCAPSCSSWKQKKQEEKMGNIHAQKKAIEWGSQIRSYVLAPYRLVTDHRTEIKVGNVDAVLDGDLDQFMVAMLLELAGDPSLGLRRHLRRLLPNRATMGSKPVTKVVTMRTAVDCFRKPQGIQAVGLWVPVGNPWRNMADERELIAEREKKVAGNPRARRQPLRQRIHADATPRPRCSPSSRAPQPPPDGAAGRRARLRRCCRTSTSRSPAASSPSAAFGKAAFVKILRPQPARSRSGSARTWSATPPFALWKQARARRLHRGGRRAPTITQDRRADHPRRERRHPDQGDAPAAREVARPVGRRDPLPPALRRPGRQPRGARGVPQALGDRAPASAASSTRAGSSRSRRR